MLRENDMVRVCFRSFAMTGFVECGLDKPDMVFKVQKKGSKLGIEWNTSESPYLRKGDMFTPFESFADSVVFENIESSETYFFDCACNALVSMA